MTLCVTSYLVLWAHFVYALVFGMIHQTRAYFTQRNARNKEADRAMMSPGGPQATPAETIEHVLPLRMYGRTADVAWLFLAFFTVAMGILPYMILFADIGSFRVDSVKLKMSWWDLIRSFYENHIVQDFSQVEIISAIVMFVAVNREILIMAGLAMFVRWPTLKAAPVTESLPRRKSAYNEHGVALDDTLTATLDRHRSLVRRASMKVDVELRRDDSIDTLKSAQLSTLDRIGAASKQSDEIYAAQPASPVSIVSSASGYLTMKVDKNKNLQNPKANRESQEIAIAPRQKTAPLTEATLDRSESTADRHISTNAAEGDIINDYLNLKSNSVIDPLSHLPVSRRNSITRDIGASDEKLAEPAKPVQKRDVRRSGASWGIHFEEPSAEQLQLADYVPRIKRVIEANRLSRSISTPELLGTDLSASETDGKAMERKQRAEHLRRAAEQAKQKGIPQPTIRRTTSLGSLTSWGVQETYHSLPFKDLRHAIIIACHNSSEVLVQTLGRLLLLVEPRAIFLADNGSSEAEVKKTAEVAASLSAEYRLRHPNYMGLGVNVGNLRQGSKTIAQFSVLNSLAYLRSDIEFVSLLDDDTVFPDDWSEQYTLGMFDDSSDCHCLAYPLGAEKSSTMGLLGHFQDFEYRISMFTKIAQASITSALFPSGAVSTWRATTLLDVLSRHDTMFRGDDLQMGLLMHTLYNEIKFLNPEEVHTGNYAIRVAPFIIPTMVPFHCLFYQRARSWEVARHRFFGKFGRVCIHSQKVTHWNTWFAKICAMDSAIGILNDFLQIAMVVYIFVNMNSWIVIGILSFTSLALQLIAFDLLNLLVIDRTPKTEIPVEVRVLYPLLYTPVLNILIKHAALVYNYVHYTPMVRNFDNIGTQARKGELDQMESSWSPYAMVQEQWEVLRGVSLRIREMEKAKRFKFTGSQDPMPVVVPEPSQEAMIHQEMRLGVPDGVPYSFSTENLYAATLAET
ncbi:hypothetical protein HKX48_002365 [Thoreauomyces humboldtii]|nr:hypothetical protein HKX48_002365 [Thoreauomyces humboldtii]